VKVKGHNEGLSNIDARAHNTQFGQQQTIVSKERFPSRYQKQNQIISYHSTPQCSVVENEKQLPLLDCTCALTQIRSAEI
jgi:hypothetical protein